MSPIYYKWIFKLCHIVFDSLYGGNTFYYCRILTLFPGQHNFVFLKVTGYPKQFEFDTTGEEKHLSLFSDHFLKATASVGLNMLPRRWGGHIVFFKSSSI